MSSDMDEIFTKLLKDTCTHNMTKIEKIIYSCWIDKIEDTKVLSQKETCINCGEIIEDQKKMK